MSNIETTAADFCNGSLEHDQARLRTVIATNDQLEIDLMIDTLAGEAINALQDICMHSPDEPNVLEYEDFKAYYRDVAAELTEELSAILDPDDSEN